MMALCFCYFEKSLILFRQSKVLFSFVSGTKGRKQVTISLSLTYKISPASCTEAELQRIRTVISVKIRSTFSKRQDRFPFCLSDCTNINVKFRNDRVSDACSRRRKRQLTQDLLLDVEFQNVT